MIDNNSSTKVLVTGGLGFIGSNLALDLINQGYDVTIVDNLRSSREDWKSVFCTHENLKIIQDCFSSDEVLQSLRNSEYDFVFHLAAIPSVSYCLNNPEETLVENVNKSIKLIDSCLDGKIKKFIFASSAAVYGDSGKKFYSQFGVNENLELNPKSNYAWHKLTVENYLLMLSNLYGFNSVSLRYFNVFGPGQFGGTPYSNVISSWCHAIKNNSPIRFDGDGKQSRDMCYISNVVQANLLSMKSNAVGSYNVGIGLEYSNESILKYFCNNFKGLTVVNAPERVGDIKHIKSNIDKITSKMGYKPQVGFWEGLNLTWKWWGLK